MKVMRVIDKDGNFLCTMPGFKKGLEINDIIEVNESSYVVEKIDMDNTSDRGYITVDTLLNNKLKRHILNFTGHYEYYTPYEIDEMLKPMGLHITLLEE